MARITEGMTVIPKAASHHEVSYEGLAELGSHTEATESYTPILHQEFAYNLHKIGSQMLEQKGFTLNGAQYVVSKDGARMFMAQVFDHPDRDDIRLTMAGRNSTDKSMIAAAALGAQVAICTNGMISGAIRVMRKHTGDAQQYLRDHLVLAFYNATEEWHNLQIDVEEFKAKNFSDRDAYESMGELWGNRIIPNTHLNPIKKLWKESALFPERNLRSFYNCCAELMKGLPPQRTMDQHLRLHSWARDRVGRKF